MGRIYDVLNSLETYNLVRSQTASRPKKYVAVEPETALDRLLADKRRELEEKAAQYEEIVDDLAEDLETAEPVDEPFWTAALGPEETGDLLVERLAAAEDRIVVVAAASTRPFDLDEVGTRVTEELEAALERGVTVAVLLRPDIVEDLPAAVGERYREHLQARPGFEVRTSENVSGTFELLDDTEVCIEVPNPLDGGETLAMIDLKDRDFAESVEGAFDERWAEATPLEL